MNLNATLLGQMIAFALFVWFCWKFVWPPLLAAMEERAKKIEQGLKDSEASAKKIVEAEEESKKMLAKAKSEAKQIMDNAKTQSEKIVEESKNKATEEKERMIYFMTKNLKFMNFVYDFSKYNLFKLKFPT